MKKLTYILLGVAVMASCTKSSDSPYKKTNLGKWNLNKDIWMATYNDGSDKKDTFLFANGSYFDFTNKFMGANFDSKQMNGNCMYLNVSSKWGRTTTDTLFYSISGDSITMMYYKKYENESDLLYGESYGIYSGVVTAKTDTIMQIHLKLKEYDNYSGWHDLQEHWLYFNK